MKRNTQGMTKPEDIDEEITQRFAMLHLAWDEAYWVRKTNPDSELRQYLHILAGVSATWRGILGAKQYDRMSPIFDLDLGLTEGICRCICDILINTHPKHRMPDSLAAELMEVSLELLELHVTNDAYPNNDLCKSFENVIHILNLNYLAALKVAEAAVATYSTLIEGNDFTGDEYQGLVNWIGPSVAYAYEVHIHPDDVEGEIQYWANDLYPKGSIDQFEHMNCKMCNGPGSPEILAQEKIRARAARRKKADI